MENRTIEEIEKEIEETKNELQNVHGTETEVYARIVGYYRSVKNWNKGKRDEYDMRKMFTLDSESPVSESKNTETSEEEIFIPTENSSNSSLSDSSDFENTENVSYEIYTRKTCPNCPPVKEFVSELNISGKSIDVDTDSGLAEAARKGVCATPTVIFYDSEGNETVRCHNTEELKAVFSKVSVMA